MPTTEPGAVYVMPWGAEDPPWCGLMVVGTHDPLLASRLAWEYAIAEEWPAQAVHEAGVFGRASYWRLPAGRPTRLAEEPCAGCIWEDDEPHLHPAEVGEACGGAQPAFYFETDADRADREHATHGYPGVDEVWDREHRRPRPGWDPACSWCRHLQAQGAAAAAAAEQRRRWLAHPGSVQATLHQLLAVFLPVEAPAVTVPWEEQTADYRADSDRRWAEHADRVERCVHYVVAGLGRRGWQLVRGGGGQ